MHDGGEDRSVPERRTLDETTIVVDLLVTRAGMLPILQASVDGNETLTPMTCCGHIRTHRTGQKHTTTTAHQPVYGRGKELAWTNHVCENVIFLLGFLLQLPEISWSTHGKRGAA